jgi:hypothetical protein
MNCVSCNCEVTSNYCPDCGQPLKLKRINSHYLIHEVEHVLHFERGILYTIKELLINPGKNVKQYLSENRSRLVKPIIFIIITSLIYTVIINFFHVEDGYVKYSSDGNNTTTDSIFKWVQSHYGYANIMMGIFIAWWIKLFFRKHDYNVFEILILLCFVMGMAMLILALFGLVEGLTHLKALAVGGFISVVYITWALGQFYGGKFSAYLKAFGAYMLGILFLNLVFLTIGGLIDAFIRH